MKLKIIKRLSCILFWAWLIFILIMTLIPKLPVDTDSGTGFIRLDYLVHFGVFGILGFFLGIWKFEIITKPKNLILILLLGISFAYFDEFLQIFIDGRTYNIVDFYYNGIGFVIGLIFVIILNKKSIFGKL